MSVTQITSLGMNEPPWALFLLINYFKHCCTNIFDSY